MDFEKKNSIYKIVMAIIVTCLITFLATSIGMYNYYTNTKDGVAKTLITTETTRLDTKIQLVRSYLDKFYLGEINEDDLTESAIKGYVEGLGDEYTEYLTKSEYENLMVNVNGNYVGIGIYMAEDKDGNVIVLLPIEGSPAEAAGLKTGDIITKVDGESCTGYELDEIANKVKGEEGTKVEIEIKRDNEVIKKTIERRSIEINQVKAEVLENNIGYIQILAFDNECSKKFEDKLNELLEKNITALIIDVRDNGGGIVDEATNIADLFLNKDSTIMIELDKTKEEEYVKASKTSKINSDLKVIILVNENSASASEIFVGALKDNNIAKLVGKKTYGKGVMQEIVPVSSGGALKVTVKEFKTPNGNVINKEGIKPDIEIDNNTKTENDEQLQKAIESCR